ncbi:MAG: peptide chain release factor 1 [Chlamydiales bacterium]
MQEKIEKLLLRLNEIEVLLEDPNLFQDKKNYKQIMQEHAALLRLRDAWLTYQQVGDQLKNNKDLLARELDAEFAQLISEEVEKNEENLITLQAQLEDLLVPPDPNDSRSVILEIRAGTGGNEAAIFVGNLARMYQNYASKKGWHMEILSATPSEAGGFKEYIVLVSGSNVYRIMKYEGGTHRVQRVPETEANGRIHTSAATVAILPEVKEEEVKIEDKDLRIETTRSSGAGGQHVNTTDSAVKITHIPTGISVGCQEERSQHKNKEKAKKILLARIRDKEKSKQQQMVADLRSTQVGSGDRSERIRTYNFPQNRVTDHRIHLTLYDLDRIMEGDMDELTQSLVRHYHQQKVIT